MSREITNVVAIILRDKKDSKKYLVVERPDDDPDHAGRWGLPAIPMKVGELPEDAAHRVCKEKLNCSATPVRFLGIMFQKRNNYDIFLMDMEMVLSGSKQPNVHEADTDETIYADQKWSDDPMDVMPAAKAGSCCSSIFLTDQGSLDRDEWIASLEGSDVVG
jgi:ADP-ribose pyrophosphatase YjhB (NUDIX family)